MLQLFYSEPLQSLRIAREKKIFELAGERPKKWGALIGQSGEFWLRRGQFSNLSGIWLIGSRQRPFGIGGLLSGSERSIRRMRSRLTIRGPPHRRLVYGRGMGFRIFGSGSTGGRQDADRALDVSWPMPVLGE